MQTTFERYTKLISEEDTLVKQIDSCQCIVQSVLDYFILNADELDILIVEENLLAMNNVQNRVHTEILLLRLEKYRLSFLHAKEKLNFA